MSISNKRASAVLEALFCRLNGLELRSICLRIVSVGRNGDDATPIKRIDPSSSDSGCEKRDGVRIPTFEASAEYFSKCSDRETEGAFIGAWTMHTKMTVDPEVYGKSVRKGYPRSIGTGKSSAQRRDCRAADVALSGSREIGLRWSVKSASDDTKATNADLRSWWDISLGLNKDGTAVTTPERDAKNATRRAKAAAARTKAAEMADRGEVNFTALVHQDESDWLTALIEDNNGDSVEVFRALRALADAAPADEAPASDEKAA